MKHTFYDVAVLGGGISGALAAVAAARAGAKTILIERYGFPGGMLTAGGVGPMMTFHAGDRQVVRGLNAELIDRLRSKGASPGHLYDTTGYTYSVTPFDAEAMKRELDLMLAEAGAETLFHTMLAAADRRNNRIAGVTLCTKRGLTPLNAAIYIDATGDADLTFLAGVPTVLGRPEDGRTQPMTMNLKLYNVDIPAIRAYIKSHPEEFPLLHGDTDSIDRAPRLSIGGFANTMRRARENGEITFPRDMVLFFETANPGEVIVNTTRIVNLDPTDPDQLSQAEVEGRRQIEELTRFLHRSVPGFAHAVVAFSGPQIGVRSSRQLCGNYTITASDVLGARHFPDAIACNAYPIDIHSPTGGELVEGHLKRGDFYTIPYRALVTDAAVNLIVTGRAISGEFAAQAAFRTTPCAGAVGHAAGAAAALAARLGVDAPAVPYPALRALLLEQKAFLP